MNLFYQPHIAEGIHHLDLEESRHCIKVLRRKVGDSLVITDGKGFFYDAIITVASEKECRFEIKKSTAAATPSFQIHIAISPTKNNERIEWFVEKAVEFGIHRISLIECDHTERAYLKSDRLRKVAVSAMKQSLKPQLPLIDEVTTLKKLLPSITAQQRFIAYVDSNNPLHLQHAAVAAQSYCVLVGPEGDFSRDELEQSVVAGFQKVSLGQSRLRTETAGLAACHILNLVNEVR
ncbi:16S rRNA (uracil(1498)-N(3))-methyltransferase [Pseudochryseolinea flava]|uniref:Ribosomal RNA small subunit methyltransferase E n=1 Tax=Pseudochryseolinea flava TaxID=2059302 RepID=A0A364Y0J8_9BACT|nr:16S rRNA (uracil(1498)-N(3))-methyltransferase [Pseudochryseolinea flava]RAV99614.1 16S rRNA (uracil(1498)-N(3))-methyltransferase [Pseudochryseolinea flava]